MGEGGVRNSEKSADVLYGRPQSVKEKKFAPLLKLRNMPLSAFAKYQTDLKIARSL